MHIPSNFSKAKAEVLQACFSDAEREPDALSYGELCGFLYVVACAPEMVNPSEWIPMILGDSGLGEVEQQDVEELMGALMALYNELNRQVQETDTSLPYGISFHDEITDNFQEDAPVSQWSRGFIYGHHWLEETWKEYVPEDLSQEFASQMLVLSFFAGRQIAEDFYAESSRPQGGVEEMAVAMRSLFPGAMEGFAELGRVIQTVLRERAQSPAVSTKVGRNEPCPCGSGKKYKKCCALKLH